MTMRSASPPWPAIAAALATLDLDAAASWDEIRRAYRDRIRATHPDLGSSPDADRRAATINGAYSVLREATDDGRIALRQPSPQDRAPAAPVRSPVVLRTTGGDVYIQLLEAAHELGDVCYMDPEAGLIQVLLSEDGCSGAHLMIEVDQEAEPARAAFTLESADAADAPPITDVVDRLGTLLRAVPTE